MPVAKKPEPSGGDENRVPNFSRTPCHGVAKRSAPLLVVDEKGREQEWGSVVFCGKDGYDVGTGQRVECYKVLLVRAKNLPNGLTKQKVLALIDGKVPTYELSWGYHLKFHCGSWYNIRSLRKVPGEPPPVVQDVMRFSEDYE